MQGHMVESEFCLIKDIPSWATLFPKLGALPPEMGEILFAPPSPNPLHPSIFQLCKHSPQSIEGNRVVNSVMMQIFCREVNYPLN
jgi:hypothetical protein